MIKVGKKDVLWSYAAQFLSVASGLIILPMVLRMLSPEEIGFNYIMLSVGSIAFLLDFGFSTQIQRNVTYIFSGVTELRKEGVSVLLEQNGNTMSFFMLKKMLSTAKFTYFLLSIITLVLLATMGTFYVYRITEGFSSIKYSKPIWALFVVSIVIQIFYLYFSPILLGLGKIKECKKTIVAQHIIKILLSFALLILGFGLLGIISANIISIIVGQFMCKHYLYTKDFKEGLWKHKVCRADIKKMFIVIWYNSKKAGIHSATTAAIYNFPILIIGVYDSLDRVASYGLMTQIISTLLAISLTLFTTFLPKLTQLTIQNNSGQVQALSSLSIFYAWSVFFAGLLALVIIGNPLLTFFKANAALPALGVLFIYGLGRIVDGTYWSLAQLLSIKNTYPYVKRFFATSLFVIISTYFVASHTNWGLLGIVLATIIPRWILNDWHWIRKSIISINLSPYRFVELGIKNGFKTVKRIVYAG